MVCVLDFLGIAEQASMAHLLYEGPQPKAQALNP